MERKNVTFFWLGCKVGATGFNCRSYSNRYYILYFINCYCVVIAKIDYWTSIGCSDTFRINCAHCCWDRPSSLYHYLVISQYLSSLSEFWPICFLTLYSRTCWILGWHVNIVTELFWKLCMICLGFNVSVHFVIHVLNFQIVIKCIYGSW